MTHNELLQRAIDLAQKNASKKGGPFGAVVAKDGVIIAEGANQVTANNDPSAHAEIVAIREACEKLNSFQLTGCVVYASCEPCPMCMGAIYWARPDAVYYAATRHDAADAGFDDAFIYEDLTRTDDSRKIPFQKISELQSLKPFEVWDENNNKTRY
jgi:guanine deaminase